MRAGAVAEAESSEHADALALIDRPLVFTQQRLLEPDRFRQATWERGVHLWLDDLERLHRTGILMPLYAVRRPIWDVNSRRSAADWTALVGRRQWGVSTDGFGLAEDLRTRLVRRGRGVRFRPWASDSVSTPTGHIRRREYLYSPYQLLDLDLVERALPLLRKRRAELSRWERLEVKRLRESASAREDGVVLLSALEAKYLPRIVQHYRMPAPHELDELYALDREFDALELLAWLRWTPDELYATARELLLTASSIDPLDAWHDLVEQVHPDLWERLRGTGRMAIDLRIAGEMILRFHEALQRDGAAAPFPAVPRLARHELNERLRRDRSRLDQVLMDFGLAPQPAVVLALEGPTEIAIARLAMETLGIPDYPSFIDLVDSGGEKRDHGFLASYVARPSLGPPEGEIAPFTRPPTRYFIVVDGDRSFRDPAKREEERQKWVRVMFNGLPAELRTDAALHELDGFVLLEAWADGLDFERAHFADAELASALMSTGLVPDETSQSRLELSLGELRAQGRPLDAVWATWPTKPEKPDIALAAWPGLRQRLEAADDLEQLKSIPIARVLLRAYEPAAFTPRRHVVFRVHPPEKR